MYIPTAAAEDNFLIFIYCVDLQRLYYYIICFARRYTWKIFLIILLQLKFDRDARKLGVYIILL